MTPKEVVDTISRRFRGGRERLFIIHGNTNDLYPVVKVDGADELFQLPQFLYRSFTPNTEAKTRTVWLQFALDSGLKVMNSEASSGEVRIAKLRASKADDTFFVSKPIDFFRIVSEMSTRLEKIGDDKNPEEKPIPFRVVATDAHLMVPDAQTALMRPEDRELLVLLKRFASDPLFDHPRSFSLIILVTDSLSGIHRELREVAVTLEVSRPSEKEMGEYVPRAVKRNDVMVAAGDETRLGKLAVGLSRRQVENVLAETREAKEPLSAAVLDGRRKELIGRDYGDFLEFFEPDWTLDDVGGSREAVKELHDLVDAFRRADRDIPSGIILPGQNGIGKTFLAKAFLGTARVTGVLLRPFQDSALGSSERNWEKIAIALRSAGQIAVLVDEADAQMGQRTGANVHEVSKRVFAMQMQLMGDPVFRGKILWILMTCRPDKLAPDVKRPGRCERVIPLFPITNAKDAAALVGAQAKLLTRKDGYQFAPEVLSFTELFTACVGKTGAQVERLLRRAKKCAAGAMVTPDHVQQVLSAEKAFDVEPAAYELQRLLGMIEAIETENEDLIPDFYREQITSGGRYGNVETAKERIDELRAQLDQ